ncbi:MAG TPA: hypothetical protein VM510_00445 [Caulifigura sp.]|jgi:hypothetical protein|nr:hypothetical protein [Caulifigura sp.]
MSTTQNLISENGFLTELASFEKDSAASADVWSLREADLERRLRSLRNRINSLRERDAETPTVRPNPIALYSSRWCHQARQALSLVQ